MKLKFLLCSLLLGAGIVSAMSDDNSAEGAASSIESEVVETFPQDTQHGCWVLFYQQGERGSSFDFFNDEPETDEDIVLRHDLFETDGNENNDITLGFGFFKDLGHLRGFLGCRLEYFCGHILSQDDVLLSEEGCFKGGKKGVSLGGDSMPLAMLEVIRKGLFADDVEVFLQKHPDHRDDAKSTALLMQKLYFDGVKVNSEELDELDQLCRQIEEKKRTSGNDQRELYEMVQRHSELLKTYVDRSSYTKSAKKE